jgi:hypothetical protein
VNIAHLIVARLLNEEHFDVHEHPELYRPTDQDDGKGRQIVQVCAYCEKEYGADKVYPPDVGPSHGYCRRHLIQQYVQTLGFTPEQAAAKLANANPPPDWQEALGEPVGAAGGAPPKATFWATAGGGY